MKACHACKSLFSDNTLAFCLNDGTPLVSYTGLSNDPEQYLLSAAERQRLTEIKRANYKKLLKYVLIVSAVVVLTALWVHNWYVMFALPIALLITVFLVETDVDSVNSDLKDGRRKVIVGLVEAQDIDVTRAQIHSYSSISGLPTTREGAASYSYWLKVGGIKIDVGEENYYKVKKGDLIEIHFTEKTQRLLSVEKKNPDEAFSNL